MARHSVKPSSQRRSATREPRVETGMVWLRGVVEKHLWTKEAPRDVRDALWLLILGCEASLRFYVDPDERSEKNAHGVRYFLLTQFWSKRDWIAWLYWCTEPEPGDTPLGAAYLPGPRDTLAWHRGVAQEWISEIDEALADLGHPPKTQKHIKQAGETLRRVLSWLETHLKARRAGMVRSLENDQFADARPDGPVEPYGFKHGSQVLPVPKTAWKMLRFLWDRSEVRIDDLKQAVWGSDAEVTDAAVSAALNDLTRVFLDAGWPWRYSKAGTWVRKRKMSD
jgi:hypothetical protein